MKKGSHHTEESKERNRVKHLGKEQTSEAIRNRAESRARRIIETGYTEAELNKGGKISIAKMGHSVSEETKAKMSQVHIGVKVRLTLEGKERKRQSLLGNQFAKNRTAPCSEETKQKIGSANAIKMKEKWQEDSYVALQMKARNCSPNKPEQKLTALINTNKLPFKYVGDGQFILGGKCPDFLGTDGKKQLIELFGTYWHGVLDIGKRVEYFRQFGYSTLIIWEDELKDDSQVIKKIKKFTIG